MMPFTILILDFSKLKLGIKVFFFSPEGEGNFYSCFIKEEGKQARSDPLSVC